MRMCKGIRVSIVQLNDTQAADRLSAGFARVRVLARGDGGTADDIFERRALTHGYTEGGYSQAAGLRSKCSRAAGSGGGGPGCCRLSFVGAVQVLTR